MAKLRPARCYKDVDKHAYTRTSKRVVRKAKIRGVPNIKVIHFDMGKPGNYKYQVTLVSHENVQIRHNALEACRIVIQRTLAKLVGKDEYHFQIRIYPHHVMRENAMISGAGADRLQTGMRHSFGKPTGRAARVKRNQIIFSVKVKTKKHADTAMAALKKVLAKLPAKCSVRTRELKDAKPKSDK
jgi:large subunit ribosomal protein L10e